MQTESPVAGRISRPVAARLVLWGLLVWAGVYGFVRAVGHVLLAPSQPTIVAGFFLATVPLMVVVTYPVYRGLDIAPAARPAAAAAMSLPGLFLDVVLVLNAPTLLPRLGPGGTINFGAILLFGYAVVLLTGFGPGHH